MRLLTRDSVPVGRHRGRPQSYRTEPPLATEGIPGFGWFSSRVFSNGSLSRAKFALVLLASFAVVACVPGQRLLTFQIEVDGRVAFEGIRSVSDSAPKDEFWNVLGGVRFDSTGTPPPGESIDVVSSDAQGGVIVRIRHVGREMGVVRVAKLALSRAVDESWRLDGESVEMVQRAAAAGEPESEAAE